MSILTERQQTAAALARAIGAMEGAWVISPLPLDARGRLRFQVLDGDKNRVLQQLRDWGWDPQFVSVLPRVTPIGFAAGCAYEIDLPREYQSIPNDGRIMDTKLADPNNKPDPTGERLKKYLSLK